jgi:A/G-specific adenine glycosylase
MLQQTQVERVLPYYERFLQRFPTVHDLARAPIAEVTRIWSGLGYNRRAVNLQRTAMAVVEASGGQFPADPKSLRALPGIGPYTAGAIAAFAFERDTAFVDTNMRRVISRVVFGRESTPEREVLAAAATLLPAGKGWVWNQALIEFGAMQCTARHPACIVCPLREVCSAYPMMQTVLAQRRRTPGKAPAVPFQQTTRYYRGRIVEELRSLPDSGVTLAQLGPRVREDYTASDLPWLRNLVEALQRDGLAVIAEDAPRYDGLGSCDGSTSRVRLP